MVDEAARLGVGYLAWSWTGNSGGVEYLDLSENGSASQLTGWGDDIVNGMNGIRATALPASLFSVQ
jgi:mannan endo-1,4-beta-mannosidase